MKLSLNEWITYKSNNIERCPYEDYCLYHLNQGWFPLIDMGQWEDTVIVRVDEDGMYILDFRSPTADEVYSRQKSTEHDPIFIETINKYVASKG